MGNTVRARTGLQDKQANAAGLVVQLVGVILVLVGAIVGLGAVILVAIGGPDEEEEAPVTTEPVTLDFASATELGEALTCANTQVFDGVAHIPAEAVTYAAPEAFQCTVADQPVFGYVYATADVQRAALDNTHVERNLCTTFPADAADPNAVTSFEAVIGTNWLIATRDAAFADELSGQLGAGGSRQPLSCTFEG